MGWTETYTGKANMTIKERKEFIREEFTQENDTHKWFFTKLSMKSTTAHGVYCVEDKTTGERTLSALSVLTYTDRGRFGFKDINPIFQGDYPLTMFNQIKDTLSPEDAEAWGAKIQERVERDKFFREAPLGSTVKIVVDMTEEDEPVYGTYTLKMARSYGSKNARRLWVGENNTYFPTSDVKKVAII